LWFKYLYWFYFFFLRILEKKRNKLTFIEFQNIFREFTLFSTIDLEKTFPGFDRKVLVEWQKKGYIKKLRNNWYCFADPPFNERDLFFVANQIYAPSYVSLKSALSYYNFIPEGIFQITSISTRKTKEFDTSAGFFRYRNIKPSLFFGYRLEKQFSARGHSSWLKIASPEKAILDFIYLNPRYKDETDFESLRFNWEEFKENVDLKKLNDYLRYFNSGVLTNRISKMLNVFYAES
jgi:predicted transcriptional regulator of viral defense system